MPELIPDGLHGFCPDRLDPQPEHNTDQRPGVTFNLGAVSVPDAEAVPLAVGFCASLRHLGRYQLLNAIHNRIGRDDWTLEDVSAALRTSPAHLLAEIDLLAAVMHADTARGEYDPAYARKRLQQLWGLAALQCPEPGE